MKKVLLLVLVAVSLTSCKKDITEVNFSTNLSKTSDQIEVNAPTHKRIASNYSSTFILDLDNTDTHDYLNQIQDIDLENVRITFQGLADLSGNTTPSFLKITINNQVIFEFNDFKYSDIANGQEFAIDDTQKINQVADLLKLTIKVEGNIPDTNMYQFFIKFMAKANISANAL